MNTRNIIALVVLALTANVLMVYGMIHSSNPETANPVQALGDGVASTHALKIEKQLATLQQQLLLLQQDLESLRLSSNNNSQANENITPAPQAIPKAYTQELDKLKLALAKLKQNKGDRDDRVDSNEDIINSRPDIKQANIHSMLSSQQTDMKQAVQQMDNAYDSWFHEEVEDPSWNASIEDKLDKLAQSKWKQGDIALQQVECHQSMCKISLTHPESSHLDSFEMLTALGNVNSYFSTRESGIAGQQETVFYISKEGEDLPEL